MWCLIYFLIAVAALLFLLFMDVRIQGKDYKTDWGEMPWKIAGCAFWPLLLVSLVLMGIFWVIFWITEQLGKLNIGIKFDKLLIKLFSKKDKESS